MNINVHNNTHAITIVRTDNYGWQIEDACFNYTINEIPEYKQLNVLIYNLRENKSSSVEFIQSVEKESFCISFIAEENWGAYYPIIAKIVDYKDGKHLYKIDRTTEWYKDFDIMKELFKADGYTDNKANELLYLDTVVRFYSIGDLFKINKIYSDIDEIKQIFGFGL